MEIHDTVLVSSEGNLWSAEAAVASRQHRPVVLCLVPLCPGSSTEARRQDQHQR